jgi:hypothetical protein
MTLRKSVALAATEDEKQVIYDLLRRTSSIAPMQQRFVAWCDRADQLYFSDDITRAGADMWGDHARKLQGDPDAMHVSINLPATYIDVPAALQAVEPIENMLATDTTEESRTSAAAQERVYVSWKQEEDFDLKFHMATIIKGLYGHTAGRINWDEDSDPKRPTLEVVGQPRNLWLGYRNDNWAELEWAAYVTRWEPNALIERFGVDVTPYTDPADGKTYPVVSAKDWDTDPGTREWLNRGDARIEVWDYWYRKPIRNTYPFGKMQTCNVVVAGNMIVHGPTVHKEYDGELPFVPLFNTFIPGVPTGRPDLYDIEQLLREKTEQVTAASQMIHNGVAGDYWQLTGPDAPIRVPLGLKPKRNELVAPGPGNRIETITPFIAQFQLEQYLGRIDRDLAAISGLNDLLLGLAPAQVLSSSKAINALIANYESRLSIRRRLLYKWRRDIWNLALKVWQAKDKTVARIAAGGIATLDIIDPSLSPRDEMETATRAGNLVSAKLWSQARAMDAVGVDDPETEQQLIREESTDATLWPERVQVMAQLLTALQSLGIQPPQGAQDQAQGQMTSGQADLRKALGEQTPQGLPGGPGPGGAPETMGQTPPLPGLPPEAGGAPPPFAQGPASEPMLMQGMLQGGQTKGRIMTQTKLGRR